MYQMCYKINTSRTHIHLLIIYKLFSYQMPSFLPYFEHQGYFSLNCGLHSLNNFLSSPKFTSTDLDQICKQLSPDTSLCCNPLKSCVGGDYDISVLQTALGRNNYNIKWVDARDQFCEEEDDEGYLLNTVGEVRWFSKLFCCCSNRHWSVVKKYQSTNEYWKLDSMLQQPIQLSSHQFKSQMQQMLQKQDVIIRIKRRKSEHIINTAQQQTL